MLESGTQIGPYQISAPLGAGGMGEVYRAKDSRLDRDVAVKVLPPQFAQDPARLARFEREAKVVAALSHPNILAIHDYGTEHGQTFAVMELLEGETLRGRVARGAIPWRRAAEIAMAIADGLAAAHEKGIIHRDLKPENIFITADGRVKVLDFGLARIEPQRASAATPTGTYHPDQTEAGTVLGTVGYMSPEQVRSQEADGRSDIFSLGCLLHEMVTGQRAFAHDTAVETMTAILHDESPDVADSGKKVPLELGRVIRHCLEKNPAARFHSAHDLAFALRAILSDSSGSGLRTAEAAARRPVAVWALAALALFGIAAAAIFLVLPLFRDRATEQTKPSGRAFDSLAILPLTNVTKDPKGDPLCEGIAEHLSGRLSQVGQLKVRAITSTAHYSGRTVDTKTVGRELNVNAVVTGRLRQDGETLVISLNLVDARDDSLVWTKSYPGNRQQILDLQDEMARDLAGKLGLHPTSDEQQRLTKRHTENPSAYMLYTEGKFHFNKFTPDGLQTGIEFFKRALNADPNYAPALAGVGRCKVLLGTLHLGPKKTHPEARELFLQALKIDANLADARAGLGAIHLFHDWDWPAAERELKLATANSGWISWPIYGFWYASQGRLPEALDAIKRGQELDPAAAARRHELGMCYNWMGRYGEAIDEAEKALKLDAKFPLAYTTLGVAHVQQGQPQHAIDKLQTAIDAGHRHPGVLGTLGCAYAAAGQTVDAQKALAQLEGLSSGRYGFAMPIARIHAALGDKDRAFEWLNKACEEHDSGVIWLKVDPTFDDSMRSDDRFNELLQKMRLAEKPPVQMDQPIDSLAVLPFVYQSGDADAEFLAEGIPQSLSTSLAQIRTLKVRPQSSVERFKQQAADDLFAVGKALQVQALVTGKIQKRGERLLVTWQLADVRSNTVVDGANYSRPLADLFQLQEDLAQEIAAKLQLKLTGEEQQRLARRETNDAEAYQLYLKGRYFWNKRTREGLEKSIACFQQAIDRDPNYALAWAGLADAYQVFVVNTDSPPKEYYPKAKAAALAALKIDDKLAEARANLAAVATFYEWDWPLAEREFRQAIELNPSYAPARQWYGEYLSRMGRFAEAKAQLDQARELEPLSLIANAVAGKMSYYAREYDAAIDQYRKTLELDPEFFVAHLFLGRAYAEQRKYEEAIGEFQRAGSPTGPHPLIGYVYARMGKEAEAQRVLDELQARPGEHYVSPYYVALIYAGLGRKDAAFEWLERAVDERSFGVGLLKVEPMVDSLRGETRFDRLLDRIGLPR